MEVAVVLKSAFSSHMKESAHTLDMRLKEATVDKNLEMEAAYDKSVNEDHEAKDELHIAENDPLSVQIIIIQKAEKSQSLERC